MRAAGVRGAPGPAGPGPTGRSPDDSHHERAWAAFARRSPPSPSDDDDDASAPAAPLLALRDVPFPTSGAALLRALVAAEEEAETAAEEAPPSPGARGGGGRRARVAAALTRARRVAALRWHPDKFDQNFARKLRPDDRAEARARAERVFRDAEAEFARLAAG